MDVHPSLLPASPNISQPNLFSTALGCFINVTQKFFRGSPQATIQYQWIDFRKCLEEALVLPLNLVVFGSEVMPTGHLFRQGAHPTLAIDSTTPCTAESGSLGPSIPNHCPFNDATRSFSLQSWVLKKNPSLLLNNPRNLKILTLGPWGDRIRSNSTCRASALVRGSVDQLVQLLHPSASVCSTGSTLFGLHGKVWKSPSRFLGDPPDICLVADLDATFHNPPPILFKISPLEPFIDDFLTKKWDFP